MIAASKEISSAETPAAAIPASRVMIAAGGTGGHVYPGIAIADRLRESNSETDILFVGTRNRMEWETVPKAGYEIDSIWISGIDRRITLRNLLFPLKLIVSLVQSFFIIRKFRPDVVVSCGGFASGPVGWVAAKLRIPLILQEQNSYPGLTTRLLAKHATVIYTAFKEAAGHLDSEHVVLAGNPVRRDLTEADRENARTRFGFHGERPVLLVMGGSGGARSINQAMLRHLSPLHNISGLQIIWQCGRRYYSELKEQIGSKHLENLRLMEFIDDMPAAYAAADLVVSRAGAISCSELLETGTPAILVPSPNVAGDHQTENAASLVGQGAAISVRDNELEEKLFDLVNELIFDRNRLESMRRSAESASRPDAADQIAHEISELIKQRNGR